MTEDEIEEKFNALIDKIYTIDLTDPKRMELILKALELSSESEYVDFEFFAKMLYIETCCQSDKYEEALQMMPWVINEYDDDPENYDTLDFLNTYLGLCNGISEYYTISKETYDKLLDDLEARIIQAGYSPISSTAIRYANALGFGDLNTYKRTRYELKELPEDDLFDAEDGWNIQGEIEYLLDYKKDYSSAKAIAEKAFENDPLDSEFYVLKLHMLLAKLEHNEIDTIKALHDKMKKDKEHAEHSYNPSSEIIFYALSLNFDLACETIEKYLNALIPTPLKYYYFYTAMILFLEVLKIKKIETIKLKLPKHFGYVQNDDNINVDALYVFIEDKFKYLENAFNQRNGNTFLSEEHIKTLKKIDSLQKEKIKL